MKKSGSLYRFLYVFVLVVGILFLVPPVGAQVNVGELDIGNLMPVEFLSYEGPHSRIETREQIRTIGYGMGLSVRTGHVRVGALSRYFVIQSVSDPDGLKLDADILGLGVDVEVDHIQNIRLIIQGYLQGAYEYSESEAAHLAHYITIYNAVYRGDWEHFSSRYKNDVIAHLARERVGLSIRYDDWPGQSLIIIPLSVVGTITPAPPEYVFGFSITRPGAPLGRIVKLDPDTGDELASSKLDTINVRTLTRIGNRIFATGWENFDDDRVIRLGEIDGDTLELIRHGDDNLARESLLWVNGQDIYALISARGATYLARFDTELILQARSSISIHPFASVSFSEGFLVTQRTDGSAVLLDPVSLVDRHE